MLIRTDTIMMFVDIQPVCVIIHFGYQSKSAFSVVKSMLVLSRTTCLAGYLASTAENGRIHWKMAINWANSNHLR